MSIVALLLTAVAFTGTAPAEAQSGVTWRGEYYANAILGGEPVLRRTDNAINFNWGTGSPDASVPADNFSVRWATDATLSAGTYRFYVQADDNIRVTFNFNPIPLIDTFADPSKVSQYVTADLVVPANGSYHIQVDYRELTDNAFAFVTFANLATNPVAPTFPVGTTPVNPGNPNQPLPPGLTSSWTVQYYANSNLLGDPTAILSDGGPNYNWGSGSPLASIPVDFFSARWSTIYNLPGGAYTIQARSDDGIRVFVNGSLVINEWTNAQGRIFSTTVTLPTGQNSVVVEYYEAQGDAFVQFSLLQTGTTVVNPTPIPQITSPSGVTATVIAFRLNVRDLPDAVNGNILTRISRAEVYPVFGRDAAGNWVQIEVGGIRGWASARFVNIAPAGANVPVVNPFGGVTVAPSPNYTGNTVRANPFNVVIREGGSTSFRRLGLLPIGAVAAVIGRNASNTWWQINYNGLIGWVSAQFAILSPTGNSATIPVTG